MKRRGLLGFFLAAPAIVAAPSLMRVSTMPTALIERELTYDGSDNYRYYSGYDTLNITASDVFEAARCDWLQAGQWRFT